MEYYKALSNRTSFNKMDLMQVYQENGAAISDVTLRKKIKVMLDQEVIARVGRNRYCVVTDGMMRYDYPYSALAGGVAKQVMQAYPYLGFSIFELIQLNEFVNHQIAHNVVFLSVEDDGAAFVFDTLKQEYPGKVLLKPSVEEFHQYWYEDMIIVGKLVTEAPKAQTKLWHTRIEKLLVDIVADELCVASISVGEYPAVFSEAFARYVIDESCLFRYAKRRGVAEKINQIIRQKTAIHLRVEGAQ